MYTVVSLDTMVARPWCTAESLLPHRALPGFPSPLAKWLTHMDHAPLHIPSTQMELAAVNYNGPFQFLPGAPLTSLPLPPSFDLFSWLPSRPSPSAKYLVTAVLSHLVTRVLCSDLPAFLLTAVELVIFWHILWATSHLLYIKCPEERCLISGPP